jgi:NADPH-dependent 7-cyano-7-deazaguanine reductase QueF-like protein
MMSIGYLHKDYFGPFEGIEIWPHYERYHWRGKVLDMITGDEFSVATDMVNLIESSFDKYPSIKTYSLLGPNSNTYTQWVLNQFPHVNIRLPWNAFGKRHVLETL